MSAPLTVYPIAGLPEVLPGDDLAGLFCRAAEQAGTALADGDVAVFAQKVVSKAEGSRVALSEVRPSERALDWARQWNKDARLVEVVLRESRRIVRMERGILIAETRHGFVCANAGVDVSNSGTGDVAILLPEDPDRSARRLRAGIAAATGRQVGVIVADSFGRPWRNGLTQAALGVAGLAPLLDLRGRADADGRPMHVTVIAVADELAGAADLVCGKTRRVPAALIRGWSGLLEAGGAQPGAGRDLVRPAEEDLFR
jgi:coenzyme F420-0:L-glutamate ligase/coenzyme F420-1:gamma-L-glutamate ligase